jgi:hypothetical protein
MGIGFVLIAWAVIGLIGAVIGSVILPLVVSHFIRGRTTDARRLLLTARWFPFACLVWAGCVFICYAVVNDTVFHRDPGIGDSWFCPLPNGYTIAMIDVTDRGYLYKSRVQDINSGSAVKEVCKLQVTGDSMLGQVYSAASVSYDPESCDVSPSYFLLDTRTGERTDFPTYDALRRAAVPINIQVRLDLIDTVFTRYRYTWFDFACAAAMFGAPLLCAWFLFRWLMRVRQTAV